MDNIARRAAEHAAERAAAAMAEQRAERHSRHDDRGARQRGVFATGRLFLGLMFVCGAIEQLVDYSGTLASLMDAGVDVRSLVPFAIGLELIAGAMVALGLRVRWAAPALVGLVLLATLVMHPDLALALGRRAALENLGLVSALLMIAAHGAGPLSLDHVIIARRRRLWQLHRLRPAAPGTASG
jgi:putative oxidoreductase